MLQSVKLSNYRCFREHEFRFGPTNIAVGLNNAGKSTLAEALRIVSIAASRFKNVGYREPPDWLTLPKAQIGCSFSLRDLQIDFDSFFHHYGEPPAMIKADFGDEGLLRIYVGAQGKTHCVICDSSQKVIRTQGVARRLKIGRIEALAQVGPVASEENVLTEIYVQQALSSRLAPIHFRNQLNLYYELFPDFQRAVEETWPGLKVVELSGQGRKVGAALGLQIRDGDFVGEVARMGHGVQMWLQTMWFLTRAISNRATTIILDEPDVYMHADLQRKLIRYLKGRVPQIVVTTHSTEIMSEVAPEDILVVDKIGTFSRRADSLPAVQRVLTSLGSAQNVHLFRLWNARRFLLVEGDDISVLQAFQDVLFPRSTVPLGSLPSASFGGWGGWRSALGSSKALTNAAGALIMTYCILDRDYHVEAQVDNVFSEFRKHGAEVHIWRRKELENYLLHATAISRAIAERLPKRTSPPSEAEIDRQIDAFANELEDDLLDGVAQESLSADRKLGASGANRAARATIAHRKRSIGLRGCVSGKQVLRRLFDWVQQEVGVSLNTTLVARNFRPTEVPEEIAAVLGSIEKLESFAN